MSLKSLSNIDKLVEQGLRKAALRVEGSAKELTPVDTGNLRASIKVTPKKLSASVGTNVEYAGYVELGTANQPPQPYLYPALMQNKEQILKDIANAIKGGVK